MATRSTERIGRLLRQWLDSHSGLSLDSDTYGSPSSYPRAKVFSEAFSERFMLTDGNEI